MEFQNFTAGKKAGENMAHTKKKQLSNFSVIYVCAAALVYPFALNDKSKCFKYSWTMFVFTFCCLVCRVVAYFGDTNEVQQ